MLAAALRISRTRSCHFIPLQIGNAACAAAMAPLC
jgi:hypothetical protein